MYSVAVLLQAAFVFGSRVEGRISVRWVLLLLVELLLELVLELELELLLCWESNEPAVPLTRSHGM